MKFVHRAATLGTMVYGYCTIERRFCNSVDQSENGYSSLISVRYFLNAAQCILECIDTKWSTSDVKQQFSGCSFVLVYMESHNQRIALLVEN